MSDESSAPRARRDADTWARFVAIAVFLVALGLLYTGNVWPPTANDADAVTETVTEVVTPATDTSWIGRAFDNNWAAVWILEFLIAALLGFLAGAITQRVRLGHYGIRLGQLELEPIPEVSESSAAAVKDVIVAADVPHVASLRSEPLEVPWWSQTPPLSAELLPAVTFQRSALEAGLRELGSRIPAAIAPMLPLEGVITRLVDAKAFAPDDIPFSNATFGVALLRLAALGDRIIAGAQVAPNTGPPLRLAYNHAIDLVLARVRATASDHTPAGSSRRSRRA